MKNFKHEVITEEKWGEKKRIYYLLLYSLLPDITYSVNKNCIGKKKTLFKMIAK